MVRRLHPVGWMLVLAAGLLLGACSRQETAWHDASREDTVAAYGAYLQDYPAGAHAVQARQRLDELREQQDWQRALRIDAPESYQRYLAAHPGGRYDAAARERLADFLRARTAVAVEPPTVTAVVPQSAGEREPEFDTPAAGTLIAAAESAGYRIQLGAFGSGERAARSAWQSLRTRHADLLGGLTSRVDVVTREGRNLWRLQAGPVSESHAREICRALVARGADCIVVAG